MCGICGLFNPQSKDKPNKKLLDRATDLMTHRGPDGRGVWIGAGVGFGHRRLAVIDPAGSPQPMNSPDSRYALTYNGEVYNFVELRRKLEQEGVRFKTQGDTEVVLQALINWGSGALETFNGMFALGFYDCKKRELLLARDRLGIKPLFYSDVNGKLLFASEFRPFFVYDWISTDPDPFGVAGYLANYQLSLDAQTIFKDIKSLDAGHYLIVSENGIKLNRYWELPRISTQEKKDRWSGRKFMDARADLSGLMTEAVKSHMISDVPVGAFLSGGIDSSVIITLMAEMSAEKVKAYSIGFDDEGYNEFQYSVPLVKELGLEHQLCSFDQDEYFPMMDDLIDLKLAPLSTPNEVPLWQLSKHLAKDIKVVLSGEGADELMGGYAPLLRSPHDFLASKLLRENPGLIPSEVRHAIRSSLRRQYNRSGFKDLLEHFMIVYSWVPEPDRRIVLNPDFCDDHVEERIRSFWNDRLTEKDNLSIYDRYLYILETEHLRGLLMRLDADTMAASVEGRVPFCDNRLVDYIWELPFNLKLHWKSGEHRKMSLASNSLEIAEKLDIAKYLLKETFKDRLPADIIKRKKKAFPVPLEAWMQGGYKEVFLRRLRESKEIANFLNIENLEEWINQTLSAGNGALKVWMVLNLAIWLENIAAIRRD